MPAYMRDFESIKEDFIEKYWDKYGPPLLSIIIHGIFVLLLLLSSKVISDDGEPARYIAIKIGSPYRSDYNNPYHYSPQMDSKIAQQQDFQEQLAEKIAQTEIKPIILPKHGNLPNPARQPQKQQVPQKFKIEVKENQSNSAASQPREAKGQKNGNSDKGQDSASYLEWLQLTVQETSRIPIQAREQGISGSAVLRLSFDRDGYVHDYRLARATGNRILDAAALRVARKLMFEPFPPMPTDFEQGRGIVTYDFPISFTP